MKQLLALVIIGLSFNLIAAETAAPTGSEQVVLFDRTNGAKPDDELKTKTETAPN